MPEDARLEVGEAEADGAGRRRGRAREATEAATPRSAPGPREAAREAARGAAREGPARADGEVSDLLAAATRLYRQGAFKDALTALAGLVERAPVVGAAHYLRGIVLKDAGSPREAVAAFDAALALDPHLERAHYHRGTARFLAQDKAGAFDDLRLAVEREPEFLFAVYNLGVVAVALRRWPEAKDAFARCLALDPANRGEYVDLLVEIGRSEAQEELYGQSHRIKNKIGVIGDRSRRLVQVLRAGRGGADAREAPQHREAIAEADGLAHDLQHVFEDMVRFLRAVDQEPPEVDAMDMRDLLDRCLFAISPKLHGVRVERHIDGWLPEVIGDRRALGEALVNVLTNAVEASRGDDGAPGGAGAGAAEGTGPGAGEAAHGGAAARAAPPVVTVTLRAIDDLGEVPGVDTVEVEVRDSGPGVAPDALPHIFTLGYTTKRFGSGLGLTYVERVVRAHGGRVEVANAPGGGAAVRLIIPASPVGAPNLRTLSLRSVLFEDLRPLTVRSGRLRRVPAE